MVIKRSVFLPFFLFYLFSLVLSIQNAVAAPWGEDFSTVSTGSGNLTAIEGTAPNDFYADLSGAFFNPVTRKLWVVRNGGPSKIWVIRETTPPGSYEIDYQNSLRGEWSNFGDLEGIAQADLSQNIVYLIIEGEEKIKAYDVSVYGQASLLNTWDISPYVPVYDGSSGSEAITFVPNSNLLAASFVNAQGNLYQSAQGLGGLMFVGHQQGGRIYVFDLNPTNNAVVFVGAYRTGANETAGLEFDRSSNLLYVFHGNGQNTLEVVALSSSVVGNERTFNSQVTYTPPQGSPTTFPANNMEGIALVPNSECADGKRSLFLTIDDAGANALLQFRLSPCAMQTSSSSSGASVSSSVQSSSGSSSSTSIASSAVSSSNSTSQASSVASSISSASSMGVSSSATPELPIDSDNDGLTDAEEDALGTDALRSDTDSDGVSDGAEISAGTNPLDPGSVIRPLGKTSCVEWNNSFQGVENYLEHLNRSKKSLQVKSILYDRLGRELGRKAFILVSQGKFDLDLTSIARVQIGSYGIICSTHNGAPGDMDGGLVSYKRALDTSGEQYDYVLMLPFSNGFIGKQVVSFNTMQPSLRSIEANDLVMNWLQLSNRGSRSVHGTLYFYDGHGNVIKSQRVTLSKKERKDIAAQNTEPAKTGTVVWIPKEKDIPVELRNVRYYYENRQGISNFRAAIALSAVQGSAGPLLVPVDGTNGQTVLELSNTKSISTTATIRVYDAEGSRITTKKVALAGYAQKHLLFDQLLSGGNGLIVVSGGPSSRLAAYGLVYARNSGGGIQAGYAVSGKMAIGAQSFGMYNTFRNQASTLWLLNAETVSTSVRVATRRSGGFAGITPRDIVIPARGVRTFSISDFESVNQYGLISVRPERSNSLVGLVVRGRVWQGNKDYLLSTPLR